MLELVTSGSWSVGVGYIRQFERSWRLGVALGIGVELATSGT